MCTAMTTQTTHGNLFFGRTMDFSHVLSPEIYFVPKDHRWGNMLGTHKIPTIYGFMGIGQDINPVVFADGVNDAGFAAAALYFPEFAHYDSLEHSTSKAPAIAAVEVVKCLLSLCASVKQAASLLRSIRIVGVKDSVTNSVAPLHWILADKSGDCAVAEKMSDGLHIMDNPVGVLSNSPNFQWHLTNLRNYRNVESAQQQESEWGTVGLTPFGQGGGTFGLPGDYTPPSRFVRTTFQKSLTLFPADRNEALAACFHVMESVSIPKGVVTTDRGTSDYTQYTAFIDVTAKEYFFRTYEKSQTFSVAMPRLADSSEIVSLGNLARPAAFV